MKFLTAEDVKWKGEKYYSSLKSKWNKDQYGIPWQIHYAGKPSVGAMVHLCNEWKPESYEHFFNLYINDKTQTTDPTLRGRSLDELEDIAIRWQKDSGDYETPLSEYFDAIILHTIIETYVGVDFEKKAISCLEENGYRVEHGDNNEDSEMNIDFKVFKDGKLKALIQVKPLSFIMSNRGHTKSDRLNVFEKHKKGHKKYPGVPYCYLIYDASTIQWLYNNDKGRCIFDYEELVDRFGNPKKSIRELKKYETDELFKKN